MYSTSYCSKIGNNPKEATPSTLSRVAIKAYTYFAYSYRESLEYL
jgi:hypothetical protein